MANNTNTPNNGEKQNEASELLDEKKNLKHTIFKDYFTSLLNTKNGTNFVRGLKANIYNGLTNGQKNTLSDGYFDYIAKSYRQIGRLADADKTIVIDELFNGKYKNDVLSWFAQEASILMKQEKTLERKILTWYTAWVPNMALTDIKTKIGSLSGQEINIANYSSSRLTNLVNAWHKEFTANTDDINFVDKKIDQVAAIIAQSGLNMSDPDVKRVTDIIEAKRSVPIDTLTRILGNIDNLSIEQKQRIFVIIRPTLSLKEYVSIIKNDTIADNKLRITKNNEIIEDIIANSGIVWLPAIASNEYKAIYNRIIERIDSNRGAIFLSTEDLFEKHGGINNAEVNRIFDNIINENIGTNDDPKKRWETLTNFSENILDAKPEEPDKDNTTLEEELTKLEDNAETAQGYSLEAIANKFKWYGIDQSDQWKTLLPSATPNTSPLFLVYRSGGYDRYVEVRTYNPINRQITFINHTDTMGEYTKNGNEQSAPVDALLLWVKNAVTLTKEINANLLRLDLGKKGMKGRIFTSAEWKWLIDGKIVQENTLDEDMDQTELEKRLKEIDSMNFGVKPGLIIKTRWQAEDGSNSGDMFIEITGIDPQTKKIKVNTVLDSVWTQNIKELSFAEFLTIFYHTSCQRVGQADNGQALVDLCKTTKKPSDFKNISYDSTNKAFRFKNSTENQDFQVGSFRTSGITGDRPDHIIIDSINGDKITYTYFEEGEIEQDGNVERLTWDTSKVKSIRKYKDVSLKFFADQLNHQHNGGWFAKETDEETTKKAAKHEEHKKHDKHHDHPPHYHGGPLQWLAHSKNLWHLFKGIGMAFGELKHFIEHGDEHVAKEMEYQFITWMKKKGGIIGKFMPEEIYLDMKAEMESKKKKNIDDFASKWGGLSTGDCGEMACALLDDSYTTTEQMFGIIFAIHKKVGTLYGIGNIQKKQAKYHMSGYPTPFPMFLYKLCMINGHDPKKSIENVMKLSQKWGNYAYEWGMKPIPEMYLISIYSKEYLQKMDPPPVPWSFHAKIPTAWKQWEQDQKKQANEWEANSYSTTDQIEKRMYMLAGDGEIAQAIGFYERLIPRGAPMSTLMWLPFAIVTTGLRGHMSTQLIRELHINGVYEQGFASSIFTALESQEKHDNFIAMLKKLADNEYKVNGQPVLTEVERKDLAAIFNGEIIPKWAEGKAELGRNVEKAKIFWSRHGAKFTQLMNVTDENLWLLQIQDKVPEVKTHIENTQGRTDNRSFEAKLPAHKNGHYDMDSGSYTVLNPMEAANSFQAIDVHTGKFKQDDASQMHEYIFMSFRDAFRRVKKIENEELRKDKFYEIFFQILKKVTEKFGTDIIRQLKSGENRPAWYLMLQDSIWFSIKNWDESGELNRYNDSKDENFRAKAKQEYNHLMWIWSITNGTSSRTRRVLGDNFWATTN